LIGNGAPENGQEPHHATKNAGQRAGGFGGEAELLLQIDGQGRKCTVIRKALEAVANLAKCLGGAHATSRKAGIVLEAEGGRGEKRRARVRVAVFLAREHGGAKGSGRQVARRGEMSRRQQGSRLECAARRDREKRSRCCSGAGHGNVRGGGRGAATAVAPG